MGWNMLTWQIDESIWCKSHNDLGIGNLVCQLLFDRLLSFVLLPLADQLMWWNYVKLDPRFSRKLVGYMNIALGILFSWRYWLSKILIFELYL